VDARSFSINKELKQPRYPAVIGYINSFRGRRFGQTRHSHYVASYSNYKASAVGQPDFPNFQRVSGGRSFNSGIS
jgi:hypothetical protein